MPIRQVKLLDLQAQYLPIRHEIRRAIDEVCDDQALILGPAVEKFERALAGYCQTKHAIGVSSGTDALLCAMMAIGIKPGDEVIVPSFTFFATAGCVARLGAVPVFAEIEPHSFNIDPVDVKRKITRKTKAIVPVDLFGQVCKIEQINEIACAHELLVLEDAAQAIGATRDGKAACSQAFGGCLSFYPTKNLGAFGDAGAICTNNDELAAKCRLLRVHGSGHQYHHQFIGGMFRLAAIQAAVLSVKLKYLHTWHEGRRAHAAIYKEMFAGTKVVSPKIDEGNWSIYNQYVVRVPNRDAVKAELAKRSIGCAVYYPIPLHLQECFAYLGHNRGDMPISERACEEVLALPVYPELSEQDIRHVAQTVLEIVGT
jgi:dTDP-4-amino-4,6-dideoxygalactose transaminase